MKVYCVYNENLDETINKHIKDKLGSLPVKLINAQDFSVASLELNVENSIVVYINSSRKAKEEFISALIGLDYLEKECGKHRFLEIPGFDPMPMEDLCTMILEKVCKGYMTFTNNNTLNNFMLYMRGYEKVKLDKSFFESGNIGVYFQFFISEKNEKNFPLYMLRLKKFVEELVD